MRIHLGSGGGTRQRLWQNNKNPSGQHKCEVCVDLLSRDIAKEQDHAEKYPDICLSWHAVKFGKTVDWTKLARRTRERTNQVQIENDILKG